MDKPETHNQFLEQLETDLIAIKESLILDVESTSEIYHNALITKRSGDENKKDLDRQLKRIRVYLDSLGEMTELTSDIKLLADQAVKMATVASTDEANAMTSVANAARSIEGAMESLAILSSDVAGIRTKASGEDADTMIARKAEKAYNEGIEAAHATELATMSSLHATIQAAESGAKFIVNYVTQFSTEFSTLYNNIQTTVTTVKDNLAATTTKQIAASVTAVDANSALIIAEINNISAKESNDADNIELGRAEAIKLAKATDKKVATTKS